MGDWTDDFLSGLTEKDKSSKMDSEEFEFRKAGAQLKSSITHMRETIVNIIRIYKLGGLSMREAIAWQKDWDANSMIQGKFPSGRELRLQLMEDLWETVNIEK